MCLGQRSKTVVWFTNVGNEHGQMITSVLTASEDSGIRPLIDCIVKGYADAQVTPPEILNVDRDCCGSSPIQRMFSGWKDLQVRLDIGHFMRRISVGCNTDCHRLYGLFMGRLSQCIFKRDRDDLSALMTAKGSEMATEHILNPSDEDVMKRIRRGELALHCRRTTGGVAETTSLIASLVKAFDGDRGRYTLGVPLINGERVREIWAVKSKRVPCIEDPSGASLYVQTGSLVKEG